MGGERLRELGAEIRRLRVGAGLSGVELARRAGAPQATVSRVETGRRVADVEVVVRILEALGGGESGALVGVAREVYAGTVSRRVDAGVSFRSGAAVELGAGVGVVRGVGVGVVPSVVRTAEYARDAGLGGGLGGMEGKRVEVVIAEGALRAWPGSGESMLGQLDHLLEVEEQGDVVVGVVPLGVPGGELAGHGFTVFGDVAVLVETFTRELTLSAEEEVRAYLELFERIRGQAVFGEEAREIVGRARRDLREVLRSIH